MVDVIHYFFEEDARYKSAEEAEAVSAMRTRLYSSLYGETYTYTVSTGASRQGGVGAGSDDLKPYIPPTQVDSDSPLPFGTALDAPLG